MNENFHMKEGSFVCVLQSNFLFFCCLESDFSHAMIVHVLMYLLDCIFFVAMLF